MSDSMEWLGWGLLAIIAYVLVSNTLYLIFGARLLQCLPGVNVQGFRGTFRLALMLLLSALAVILWAAKWPIRWVAGLEVKGATEEIQRWIAWAARVSQRRHRENENSRGSKKGPG